MDYPNDDILLILCWRHNTKAFNLLFKRYSEFIRVWASEFIAKNPGLDFDELVSVGQSSFLIAIKSYKRGVSNFYKFLYAIVLNKFKYIRQKYLQRKRNILYSNSSDNSEGFYVLSEPKAEFKYSQVVVNSPIDNYRDFLFLTDDMKDIISFKLLGLTNKEIASKLFISIKKVDNLYMEAKRRIKNKQI